MSRSKETGNNTQAEETNQEQHQDAFAHDRKNWGSPIGFELPEHAKPAEVLLAKDIVRLDRRSIWTLGATPERGEVYRLLYNVVIFLGNRQPEAARLLLDHAQGVYYQHIQAKNRLRYLAGMLAGICIIVLFGWGLIAFLPKSDSTVLSASLLPLILLFAGMGSITSVLTRLSSIDLRDQTSRWMILISGMARPVTGLFGVYLVH